MAELRSPRATLRSFISSDLASLCEMMNDPRVMAPTGFRGIKTQTQVEELLDKWIVAPEVWAAIESETSQFIGWFMLKRTNFVLPELGFMLPQAQWGRGYATELGEVLLDYAKNVLRVGGVAARVDTDNLASHRVLLKLGMKKVSRPAELKDGDYYEIRF